MAPGLLPPCRRCGGAACGQRPLHRARCGPHRCLHPPWPTPGEGTRMTSTHPDVDMPGEMCSAGCGCEATLLATADRGLRRRAWWLAALTIGWNSLEAIIAIASGLIAGSIALIGFGLDSLVEVASALVIVWRLSHRGIDRAADERIERRAVRLIALTFFAIAVYV